MPQNATTQPRHASAVMHIHCVCPQTWHIQQQLHTHDLPCCLVLPFVHTPFIDSWAVDSPFHWHITQRHRLPSRPAALLVLTPSYMPSADRFGFGAANNNNNNNNNGKLPETLIELTSVRCMCVCALTCLLHYLQQSADLCDSDTAWVRLSADCVGHLPFAD